MHCAPQAYACPSCTCGIAEQGQILAIAPLLGMRPCAQGGAARGRGGHFEAIFRGWLPGIGVHILICSEIVITFLRTLRYLPAQIRGVLATIGIAYILGS